MLGVVGEQDAFSVMLLVGLPLSEMGNSWFLTGPLAQRWYFVSGKKKNRDRKLIYRVLTENGFMMIRGSVD